MNGQGACNDGGGLRERRIADAQERYEEIKISFVLTNYPQEEQLLRLREFLDLKPSCVHRRVHGISKIKVRNSGPYSGPSTDEMLKSDFKQLCENSEDSITFSDVKQLAITYGYVTGSWLLFFDKATCDDAWKKIAEAWMSGNLGYCCAVSSGVDKDRVVIYGSSERLITVKTNDFTDEAEVMRVEQMLRQLGIKGRMHYKPQVFGLLEIHNDNIWGLRPSIFNSLWDLNNNESIITRHVD